MNPLLKSPTIYSLFVCIFLLAAVALVWLHFDSSIATKVFRRFNRNILIDHSDQEPQATFLKSERQEYSQASSGYSYPQLPAYVASRPTDIPVSNHYHTNISLCKERSNAENECGDFHLVLYYLDVFSGWLSIRRLDDLGWNYTIHVSLFDKDENNIFDTINIGPSENVSFSKQLFNTKISLHPDYTIYRNQTIPKRIIQTYYRREAFSPYHWNAYHTFLDLNPEYEIIMLNNQASRAFMKANFAADVVTAYDSLVPAAFQADLFRYSYLYVHGGCYFDNKMIARQAVRNILQDYDEFIVASDTLPGGYMADSLGDTRRIYNAVICSQPRDKRLYDTIMHVLSNIESRGCDIRFSFMSDLALTGPTAFYRAIVNDISEKNLRLKHGYHPTPSFSKNRRDYTDYYIINKLDNSVAFHKAFKYYYRHRHGGYSKLWKEGRVFYDKPILLKGRYYVYLESSSTRLYEYKVNDTAMIVSRLPSLFSWEHINNLSPSAAINHVKAMQTLDIVATTSDGKSFSYVSGTNSCANMANWFTSSSEALFQRRRLKNEDADDFHRDLRDGVADVHVGRNTFVKIVDDERSEELMLSFDLSLSMNIITKIDICL